MLLPGTRFLLDEHEPQLRAADYDLVRRAVEFIVVNWRAQPDIQAISAHLGLSGSHLHHVFRRWAGLTPKAFLQAVTIDHARRLLRDRSLLDASLELGLSGPGRLHDLFVQHEAMSPGEWKTGGVGLEIRFGFHDSMFGQALVMATKRGLCGLGFVDEAGADHAFEDMRRRWPLARFVADAEATRPWLDRALDPLPKAGEPLRVVLIGSDFDVQVWRLLLTVPRGQTTSYSQLAARMGRPGAARAVGSAVGRNPIAFVVPCHRVVGKAGLAGYHWGVTRKRVLLGWEAAGLPEVGDGGAISMPTGGPTPV